MDPWLYYIVCINARPYDCRQRHCIQHPSTLWPKQRGRPGSRRRTWPINTLNTGCNRCNWVRAQRHCNRHPALNSIVCAGRWLCFSPTNIKRFAAIAICSGISCPKSKSIPDLRSGSRSHHFVLLVMFGVALVLVLLQYSGADTAVSTHISLLAALILLTPGVLIAAPTER